MRPHSPRPTALTGAIAIGLALGACSSTNGPSEGSTVHLTADYPSYDTTSLVEQATLIVEGTVLDTESTVLAARHEGDTRSRTRCWGCRRKRR
ncbi:hypothetical protein NKG05_29500 [Oerskovia sp. M15]